MSGTVSPSFALSATGRTMGYLRVGDSTNSSGWATFHLPIINLNAGSGPKVLVIGGNHGDEYEGQFAAADLAANLDLAKLRGQIIVIPCLSLPASYASTRLWPTGENFNRLFPGDENGSIAQKLAHFLATELIPYCDAVVDLHSGGRGHYFLASGTASVPTDGTGSKSLVENVTAWQTDYAMIFPSQPRTNSTSLLPGFAAALGKSIFTAELGGAAVATARSIAIAKRGLAGVLSRIGVTTTGEDRPEARTHKFIDLRAPEAYHNAPEAGLYENLKPAGSEVRAGELIGRIHFTDSPDRPSVDIPANCSGVIGVIRGYPRVKVGDCVAVIGPAREAID